MKEETNGQSKEEISLKEIILKISEWLQHLLFRWKILLLALVTGALAGLVYSFTQDTKYTAEVTFVLEGDNTSSGSMGMYTGLARQFGFDLGGGSAGTVFSGENFIALLQSRLLIERTLLTPIDSSNRKQSLANYYIQTHDMWKEWGMEESDTIAFPPSLPRDSFSLRQSAILKTLYQHLLKEHLTVERGEKSSFITAACVSENELFSKLFLERLMTEAADFYVQTKTKRSRESITKLEAKADSIETVLNKKTYAVASSQDLNRNPARQMATVGVEVAARDQQILQRIYAEVVQNLEISKISLLRETPLIQVIDGPVLPLKKESSNAIKLMLIGGFLTFFLTAIVLLVLHIYKEIMQS